MDEGAWDYVEGFLPGRNGTPTNTDNDDAFKSPFIDATTAKNLMPGKNKSGYKPGEDDHMAWITAGCVTAVIIVALVYWIGTIVLRRRHGQLVDTNSDCDIPFEKI